MNTTLTQPQIVRFDGLTPGRRPYWQACAFKPDGLELVCYWLTRAGWVPAQRRHERRHLRFRTAAAARLAMHSRAAAILE